MHEFVFIFHVFHLSLKFSETQEKKTKKVIFQYRFPIVQIIIPKLETAFWSVLKSALSKSIPQNSFHK